MSEKNRVPAVERALDILECFIECDAAMGVSEIAERLAIPRVSAFRIMKSLESRGFLCNQATRSSYVLGPKIVSICSRISRDANLIQIANPFMFELARRTSQTVQLGVLFEYQVMYIDQIRTTESLTLVVPSRTPFAVNTSAGGKVLVADLSAERQEDFLRNTVLAPSTPRAIVDKAQFRTELVRVRERGYATDDEEWARGIRCVAAPIRNSAGDTIASLGITGHTQQITETRLPVMIRETREAAERISLALGYREAARGKKSARTGK